MKNYIEERIEQLRDKLESPDCTNKEDILTELTILREILPVAIKDADKIPWVFLIIGVAWGMMIVIGSITFEIISCP